MKKRRHWYSISRVFFMVVMAVALIAGAVIGYFEIRQRSALLSQSAAGSIRMLDTYANEIEDQMESLELYMFNSFYENSDIASLVYGENEVEEYLAQQTITDLLTQMINLSGIMECAWVYIPETGEEGFLARCSATGIMSTELSQMNKRIAAVIEGTEFVNYANQWRVIKSGDEQYLVWMTGISQGYCGAWLRLEYLVDQYNKLVSSLDGLVTISDSTNKELLLGAFSPIWEKMEGKQGGYTFDSQNICVYMLSEKTGLTISVLFPEKRILEGVRIEFNYTFAAACALLLIVAVVAVCQFYLYRPFNQLFAQLKNISVNTPDIQLTDTSGLLEIHKSVVLINSLLGEISNLKISIYETRIQEREIQCQYLQVRLKSHFFMNCLSIIHAMARVKKTELIQEMTLCLVRYMRFLQNDSKFVSLEAELEHVRNYTRIQELRFPELFTYKEDVDVNLLEFFIPPIILQTFIENSIEHGMQRDKNNWVEIKARFQEKNEKAGMCIIISDNGKGFSAQELDIFSAIDEQQIVPKQKRGIGIRNVVLRLRTLYGDMAQIRFENRQSGGAVIYMWLPFVETDVEE